MSEAGPRDSPPERAARLPGEAGPEEMLVPIEAYAALVGVPLAWLDAHPDLPPAYYRPEPKP